MGIAPVGTLRQMIRKLAVHCRNEEVRGARAHTNPFLRADMLPSTKEGHSSDAFDGSHGFGDEVDGAASQRMRRRDGNDPSAHDLVLEALPSLLPVGGHILNSLSVIVHTVGQDPNTTAD